MRQKRGFDVPVVVSILALNVAAWTRYDAGRSADAAEDARDAVRLEQRAWLGYREITLAVAAQPMDRGKTENLCRVTTAESGCSLRIQGKHRPPTVDSCTKHPCCFAIVPSWNPQNPQNRSGRPVTQKHVVVPGTEERFHDVQFRLNRQARYVNGTHVLFVWVRMEYCDVAHRPHWTQAGVMHHYGEPRDDFWTLSQSISPADSGEPDYERCSTTK